MIKTQLLTLETQSIELIKNSFIENFSISTTSFGITSSVLIHLISKTNLEIPIVFIDTGFHFDETIDYYKTIDSKYQKLDFIKISADISTSKFLNKYGKEIYNKNPNFCCNFNKVAPFNSYLENKRIRIWYTAVRKSQSSSRNNLNHRVEINKDLLKIHPLLLWTEKEIIAYLRENSLPIHPLKSKGYGSIGCYPCTKIGKGRTGRWGKLEKTECGLHLETSPQKYKKNVHR